MFLSFTAEIRGAQIHCTLTSQKNIEHPVFCFSLMAPPDVVSGGTLIHSDGSYGEVQLPDLGAGTTHHFVLRYANPTYEPKNRAWLPLGAYLRCDEEIIELPPLPAGVEDQTPGPIPPIRAEPPRGSPCSCPPSG